MSMRPRRNFTSDGGTYTPDITDDGGTTKLDTKDFDAVIGGARIKF